jgi:hypothetical protein
MMGIHLKESGNSRYNTFVWQSFFGDKTAEEIFKAQVEKNSRKVVDMLMENY